MPWRVLIVDDNELVREGIAAVIGRQARFVVCGFASDEQRAVELIERHKPHLVVLDLFLRHRDGVHLVKDLTHRFPGLRVLVHSVGGEGVYASRLLHAGASAYLRRSATAGEVVQAITSVMGADSGEAATKGPKEKKNRLTNLAASGAGLTALTDRELHVFQLIGRGLGTGRIATELGLSRKTIEYYREQIKTKLACHDAEDLLEAALDWARTPASDATADDTPASRKKPGISPVVKRSAV